MIYQLVGDKPFFVKGLDQDGTSIITSGGVFDKQDLIEVHGLVLGVLYISDMCTYLPVDWPYRLALSDNNKVQHIKDIRFEESPSYVMEDGSLSWEVVIY